MVTTDIIRHYYPPESSHKIGELDINPNNAVTASPSYLQSLICNLGLSSPEENYSVKLERHSNGKPLVRVQHRKTDRERRNVAKGTIATLEERLKRLEDAEKLRQDAEKLRQDAEKLRQDAEKVRQDAEKVRQDAEKEQERQIFVWETYDRIAQVINDFLKRAVRQSLQNRHEPDLQSARYIVSENTTYTYLPFLFTTWWIYWNAWDPHLYPLPPALRSLQPITNIPKPLSNDLEAVAGTLWDSKYQPLIQVMLAAYHARPKKQNAIQHAIPSKQRALDFVNSSDFKLLSDMDLFDQGEQILSTIIKFGVNTESRGEHFFLPSAGEVTFLHHDQLDKKLEAILTNNHPSL